MSIKIDDLGEVIRNKILGPIPLSKKLFLTLLLWSWAVPAAYFWYLVNARNIILPILPRLIWLLPGELWRRAPPVFIIFILVLTFIFYFFPFKKQSIGKSMRFFLMAIFILINAVNFLWGVALYKNLS